MGYIKDSSELMKIYGPKGDHPRFSRASWKSSVALDQTQEGYWGWITIKLVREFEAMTEEELVQAKKRDVEHLVQIGYYR